MSSITVANIAFETTDSNGLEFINGSLAIVAGNNNTFLANSTFVTANIVSIGGGNIANDVLTYTSNVSAATTTTNGQVIFSGNVSPTMLSASTSDWNPLIGNAYFVRASSNTALTLYGMIEGTNNQVIVLNNIGNSAITLSNEDAANENTASRRFRLPDNITVYPASSISLIYDGNIQRWKTQNSTGTPSIYKSLLTKSFFSGGQTPTNVTTTERITYSTETNAVVAGAALSVLRTYHAGAGNSCKGFFTAGTPGPSSSVDRTTYSTESTAAVPTTNLSAARCLLSAAGNACKGFFSGGSASPLRLTTTDRLTYASETNAAISGSNLSLEKAGHASSGNSCKGFFSGGLGTSTFLTTSDRITYATETNAAVAGAALSVARYLFGASGNACKGFFSGGYVTSPAVATFTTTERITYATETNAAVPGANLNVVKRDVNSAGNVCKSFIAGGTSSPNIVSSTERITYATETNAVAPAGTNLSAARARMAAI